MPYYVSEYLLCVGNCKNHYYSLIMIIIFLVEFLWLKLVFESDAIAMAAAGCTF